MSERTQVTVDGRTLSVSNLDKVLYPADGTTKAQVIRYYLDVAEVLLPHVAGRPMTLRRFPDGVEQDGFFAKRRPAHAPSWIGSARLGGEGSTPVEHPVLDEPAALAWAANLGAIELHAPLGLAGAPDVPTAMILDLDPGPPAGLLDAAWLALELADRLERLGAHVRLKTSGGKGIHVVVPLDDPHVRVTDTRAFAQALAGLLLQTHPDRVVAHQRRADRVGKVLIDWQQNHRTKTTVAAYSLRAGTRPHVSTPVTLDEVRSALDAGDEEALRFGPDAVRERIAARGDLLAPDPDASLTLPRLPNRSP